MAPMVTLDGARLPGRLDSPIFRGGWHVTPEEVVTTFIAAIERGDVDGALAYVTADCEYDNVPIGKTLGVDAIRQTLSSFVSPDHPPEFKIVRQAAQDHVVFNERIDRVQLGSREITIPVAGVWEIDPTTSKIKPWRDYFDMGQMNAPA